MMAWVSKSDRVQGGDNLIGVDGMLDVHLETLSGAFVDDVQQLDLFAVDGAVELEIHCPQRVRANRAHPPDW